MRDWHAWTVRSVCYVTAEALGSCLILACPGPAGTTPAIPYSHDPGQEIAWGFGLSEPQVLLNFRKYEATHAPEWCFTPSKVLEQIASAIQADSGGTCTASLVDSPLAGQALHISCPIKTAVQSCTDVYLGTVWGNKYDDAPANYGLYGLGWVRRTCSNSKGDFNPSPQLREAANKTSKALKQLLDECR